MTTRDRIVLMCISVVAVLGAVWLLAVSPERQKAAKLATQVSSAQAQLASAEGQVANARQAQAKYAAAYASVVSLGKAVPSSQEVPSLIYELDKASEQKQVDFASITAGSSGSSGAGASAAASSSASAGGSSAGASGGFSQMPFTFVFNGTYPDLYHLFQQLNRFTMRSASGALEVNGRLLTIQGIQLAPATESAATPGKAGSSNGAMTGTITATAYVLPAAQGLTGGATPAAPPGGASQPAAAAGAPGAPTAPAIVRVGP